MGGPLDVSLPPHDWHAPIIASIVGAYQRVKPARYVEIGVDQGHTLAAVAAHLAPHGKVVSEAHGVDVTFANLDPYYTVRAPRGEGLHERRNVFLHEQTSDDYFASWPPGHRADVVFVDGDHTADQVAADVNNALGIIKPNGLVIVHDTLPQRQEWADSNCGDGWRTVNELQGDERLQVFTVPLFPGLTLVSPRPNPIVL